jgi:hypothetical protein
MSALKLQQARRAMAEVSGQVEALDVFGGDARPEQLPGTAERRRATRRGLADPLHRAALFLNDEGILEWRLDPRPPLGLGGRRSAGASVGSGPPGELVDLFEFESLGVNQVSDFLDRTDQRLNPRCVVKDGGTTRAASRLWRLRPGAGDALPQYELLEQPPAGSKRRLLLVHGTFSQSQAFLDGIGAAGQGKAFLTLLFKTYDEVLAFEHPTLSVSPVLNALDLHDALAGISGPMDVIAHSRGGLVVRWALDVFGLPAAPVRAVLVGTPLGGTSLAAPDKLRATLGLLSNFGAALQSAGGVASAWMPLLVAPLAILRVASSAVGAVARTPVLDGAIALVPGLAAQSRVAGNPELSRLSPRPQRDGIDYALVGSDFQPADPGWHFWRWFRKGRIANAAADSVFPGANDLVVDSDSMLDLTGATARHDFGRSDTVHHTNYFQQNATLAFIRKRFGLA